MLLGILQIKKMPQENLTTDFETTFFPMLHHTSHICEIMYLFSKMHTYTRYCIFSPYSTHMRDNVTFPHTAHNCEIM